MIDINKKYRTRSGNKVTVLSTNLNSEYPIAVIVHYENKDVLFAFQKDGKALSGVDGADDLIEVSPYEDFKIDDKVLVWNEGQPKIKRYFAGIGLKGEPMAWNDGCTEWNATGSTAWDHCEKAEE